MLSACDADPECDPGNIGDDTASRDQKHVARVHETFCGGPGASDGWTVGIRNRGEDIDRENSVFITFNSAPIIRWTAENELTIEITDIDTINKSERESDGISIKYILANKLTRSYVIERLRVAQKEYEAAQGINRMIAKNEADRYVTFLKWTEDYITFLQ